MMFYFFKSFFFGLDERVEKFLYTCMLSALIISPFNILAISKDNFDLPEAVGPAMRINFLVKLIQVLDQDIFFDYYCL